MKQGLLALAAWAMVTPALADDVSFQGHVLDVDASQSPAVVRTTTGSRYVVAADAATLATRARACLAAQPGVTGVAAADGASGRIEADLAVQRISFFSSFRARSRIAVETGDQAFQLRQSGLVRATVGEGGSEGASGPVAAPDAGGGKVLEALFEAEQQLVDCLYR